MKNFIQPGEIVEITAPAAVVSGQALLVDAMFGVITTDAAINTKVNMQLTGIFSLPKNNPETWTAGQLLYWDDTAKEVTNVSTANTLIGVSVDGAASADTTGEVRLNGSF